MTPAGAGASAYRPRACHAAIAELSVHVGVWRDAIVVERLLPENLT